MEAPVWLSLVLGTGIGLLYGLAVYATHRIMHNVSTTAFMGLMVGGMLARMVVLLVLVALVLWLVPVHVLAFAGSLVTMLIVGLGVDVWLLYKRLQVKPADS